MDLAPQPGPGALGPAPNRPLSSACLPAHALRRRPRAQVILDNNGQEKERIDLQGFTASKLESLMRSKGFKKR